MSGSELSEIQKGLLITLTIGAALEDADRLEARRLRDEVQPLVKGVYFRTGDTTQVIDKIQEIMGPDWRPGPRWKSYIESVTGSDG